MAHPGGRPPKYTKVEEIEGLIEDYFNRCDGIPYIDPETDDLLVDKYGNIRYKVQPEPYTVTGLALALGFTSRLALLNYQDKPEFFNAITRAKARVEQYAERRLYDKDGNRGAMFSLANNFKSWKNEKDINVDGGITIKLEGNLEDYAQ